MILGRFRLKSSLYPLLYTIRIFPNSLLTLYSKASLDPFRYTSCSAGIRVARVLRVVDVVTLPACFL